MAVPSTKATLKSYCLRALGFGVIDINVSDDQIDDRLDEALQYPVPPAVLSVVNIFPITDSTTSNMFDLRYQLRLNDLYDFSSTSIMEYQMTLQHLDFLEHVLVGEIPIRFSQHQQRLYLDMDWNNDIEVDEYIIMYLKRYATALIKRQWGANLSKFNGVTMLGGVTMNGDTLYSQAQEELQRLEEQIQLAFELPVNYMIG